MTPEQLKASILQLAIQGKLVPQRPEEGTAEELYRQIQREKKNLTAAGKLKKEKPFPPITEDEIPFDIPDSWKWVRLGELYNFINGDRGKNYPAKSALRKQGIPFISAINIRNKSVSQDGLLCVSEEQFQKLRSGHLVKGDIVVCIRGSLGKFCVYPFEQGAIASSLVILRHIAENYDKYVEVYLETYYFQEEIAETQNGTAQPNLSAKDFANFILPIPPLAEQQRIVKKIEQMLPLVEQYGEAYTALEFLDTRFPEDMRKSILQYAIQGKLVPQSPEDGTAEELYQQIQKEKKKLIAAGKLKKEKPLPPITEEEIPFDIPDSWKWVRMGDIFMHNTGKAQNSTAETRNGITRKFITTSNVYWNRFDFTKVKEMLFTEKEIEKCSVQKGDLLVCEGGDCGRAAIWQDGESMCIQNHIHRLRPIVGVEVMFFYYIFWLLKQMGYINGKGVGIKGLSSNTLHKLPCPLPPLAEQERIVKKLELILLQVGQTTAPTNA